MMFGKPHSIGSTAQATISSTKNLNYIHANPCAGKWHLSSNPESYLHSSAGYYATGVPGIYSVEKVPLNV
jgi:hypothetical protein